MIPPELGKLDVSIPNGDRHYLEQQQAIRRQPPEQFQSPMGIGITSNSFLGEKYDPIPAAVSIPNGDRHYLELEVLLGVLPADCERFNPQWG